MNVGGTALTVALRGPASRPWKTLVGAPVRRFALAVAKRALSYSATGLSASGREHEEGASRARRAGPATRTPSISTWSSSGFSGDPSQEPPGRRARGPTQRVGTPLPRPDEAGVDEFHAVEVAPDLLVAARHHWLLHPAEHLDPLGHGFRRVIVPRNMAQDEVAARWYRRSEAVY